MNLREWQEKGYKFFINNNNSLFESATGAGKTFFAIYCIKKVIEKNPNIKILIVGPKNVILEKTWLDELSLFGFPINKVGIYNGFTHEFSKITLVSIQSLHKLIEGDIYHFFDFVIFDEIHNYATKSYLDIVKIPKKYKIGLSATIKREDNKHLSLYDTFDYNIFTYDIKQALKDKILNPFIFQKILIKPDEELKEKYDNLSKEIKELENKCINKNIIKSAVVERKKLVSNYNQKKQVLKRILKENPGSKVLVFNQYNSSSTDLYWELMDDSYKCDIMNSVIPKEKQGEILTKFENEGIDILLATTMLDEGYNLPKIDVAIIMASNRTMKQFIQRMGRVLRKKNKPSKVYFMCVQGTYEEEHLNEKLPLIKNISQKYSEVYVE